MSELERRLDRIEQKLDAVLVDHVTRITKLETQASTLKAGLGILSSLLVAGFVWLLNHLPK